MVNLRLVGCVAVASIVTLCGSVRADTCYGSDPFTNRIFRVNLATGALSNSVPVTLPGFNVTGITGITANPHSGTVYAIAKTASGQGGRKLVTLNPDTGAATFVGDMPSGFSSITFSGTGMLYGMTGQGGTPASTLHVINTTTGTVTALGQIQTGPDGEVIAFGGAGGTTLYHSSGNSVATFSTVNLTTFAPTTLGTASNEMFGMGFNNGTLYGTDIASQIFTINPATGARTLIGQTAFPDTGSGVDFVDVRGLAFVPCKADFNKSGGVEVQDIFDFLNSWFAGCP